MRLGFLVENGVPLTPATIVTVFGKVFAQMAHDNMIPVAIECRVRYDLPAEPWQFTIDGIEGA